MLILKSLRRLLVYIYIYKILGSFGTSGVSLKMVFRHGGGVAKQLDISYLYVLNIVRIFPFVCFVIYSVNTLSVA